MPDVLIVDDDALTRSLTVHLLKRSGVAAVEAASGRDALRLLAREPRIHTLVTDVLMPDMDGLELTQAARRMRPNLRIVAMSAGGYRVTMDLLPAALSLGADLVFRKPLDQANLARMLALPGPSATATRAAEDAELGAVAMIERHGA